MTKEKKGAIYNCPEYLKCPVCYGCRNYNPSRIECIVLCKDNSSDHCNTEKHRPDLLAKLYKDKQVYNIGG